MLSIWSAGKCLNELQYGSFSVFTLVVLYFISAICGKCLNELQYGSFSVCSSLLYNRTDAAL